MTTVDIKAPERMFFEDGPLVGTWRGYDGGHGFIGPGFVYRPHRIEGDVVFYRLDGDLEAANRRIAELEAALRQIMEEKIDYMRINNLGDPEMQHTIRAARAALMARDTQTS